MIKNALDSAGSGKQASDRAMEAVIEGRLSLEKAFAENLIVLDAGGAHAAHRCHMYRVGSFPSPPSSPSSQLEEGSDRVFGSVELLGRNRFPPEIDFSGGEAPASDLIDESDAWTREAPDRNLRRPLSNGGGYG